MNDTATATQTAVRYGIAIGATLNFRTADDEWTKDPAKARTWATKRGAQAKLDALRAEWSAGANADRAASLCLVEFAEEGKLLHETRGQRWRASQSITPAHEAPAAQRNGRMRYPVELTKKTRSIALTDAQWNLYKKLGTGWLIDRLDEARMAG